MIKYTKRNVLIITLTLTVLIYVVISVICSNLFIKNISTTNETEEIEVKESTKENIEPQEQKIGIWQIQIPKINLIADIKEGTTGNVMARYVGHFNKTSTLDGNIGLAAHNRGFGVKSYFKNIKELGIGDEIIYKKDEEIRRYKVIKNVIINETDWTYLEGTNDNRITLITCVENKPEYRRCVQAVQI